MTNIFLLGMPGSGKSTMGKFICSKLSLLYIDLDIEIENYSNRTISEIFEQDGEDYFRKLESKLLLDIINKKKKFVLATGGGTPCFNDNMDLILNNGISIFLDTSLDVIIERVSRNTKRPMFKNKNVKEIINDLYNKRKIYYRKSNFIVTDNNRKEVLSIINSYSNS